MYKQDFTDFVGNTPLVKLRKIVPKGASDVYLKLEEFNPGGSIKTRVALQMIFDAEKKGRLHPFTNQTIIEPTGGNTGIGLSIIAAIRGYKIILVVPDNFSKEKMATLRVYGATVIESDHTKGNDSHITKTKEIIIEHPDYIWLDQFSNPSNPLAHYLGTGKEIIERLEKVDCFVAGVGSGGTLTGVGRCLKERNKETLVVAVQPKGCDVLKGKAVPHKILALAIGVLPTIFDVNIVDRVISVEFDDVISCLKTLARKEGLFLGLSSGANIFASLEMAKELGEQKTVVTVSPDSGRSYLDAFREP
jgi:cysteine synthase